MTIEESVVEVREAAVEEILPLRKAVLRPMEPVVVSDYDGYPGVRHIGAFDGGVVVGCATVFPAPYDEDEADAWQLRGMAVDPGRQGLGIGRRVLGPAIELVRATGSPLLWAKARVTALPFYQAMGFEVVDGTFSLGPAQLPHNLIRLSLTGEGRVRRIGP